MHFKETSKRFAKMQGGSLALLDQRIPTSVTGEAQLKTWNETGDTEGRGCGNC